MAVQSNAAKLKAAILQYTATAARSRALASAIAAIPLTQPPYGLDAATAAAVQAAVAARLSVLAQAEQTHHLDEAISALASFVSTKRG